jgi:multidrug efflux pump subunit AcrA (membrane-fusion protein)
LDALQAVEQRAHDRAESTMRDAERAARQLTLESEQRAYQVTSDAEQRARQLVSDAEQRAKQVTLEAAQRLAELEQQLSEVRDNLETARAQLEEQVVSVRGQVDVARANLNTVRERLTASGGVGGSRLFESRMAPPPAPPRLSIPSLSSERETTAPNVVPAPTMNDLRAAVDALKRRRPDTPPEPDEQPERQQA